MKNRIFYYLLVLGSITIGCNEKKSKKRNEPTAKLPIDTVIRSIDYVCDISRDTTLIVADPKIMMTIDAGKRWHSIKEFPVINQVTVDNKNIIWAIYYWGGLHEPGGSTLLKSSDWGKNWEQFEFDLKQFAPEKIVSNVHERLSVISKDKVYVLMGDNPRSDFSECKQCLKPDNFNDIALGYSSIDSNNQTIIFKKKYGKPIQIAALDSVGTLRTLLKSNDTLFAVGNGIIDGDFAIPYFSTIVGKRIKRYHVPSHGIEIYKGFNNRIWAVFNDGLYMRNDTGFRKISVR